MGCAKSTSFTAVHDEAGGRVGCSGLVIMPASGVRRVCGGLLHAILGFSLVDSLPLHIRRDISPTALQGDNMVDDVAGA